MINRIPLEIHSQVISAFSGTLLYYYVCRECSGPAFRKDIVGHKQRNFWPPALASAIEFGTLLNCVPKSSDDYPVSRYGPCNRDYQDGAETRELLDRVLWDRSTQPPLSKPCGRQFEMALEVAIFVSSQHSASDVLNVGINVNGVR
jgi:hypothetical protein